MVTVGPMRWLTLLMSLPPTPTRHRVGVWRKLKRMGAINLRGSAWILPENPETTEQFHWLVQEVQSFGGEATLLRVDGIETMSDEEITTLFNDARAAEYETVKRECREALARLDRFSSTRRASMDPLRAKLEGLKRELDRIQAIDYFHAPIGDRARALWETTAKRLRKVEARPSVAPVAGRRRTALPPPADRAGAPGLPGKAENAPAWSARGSAHRPVPPPGAGPLSRGAPSDPVLPAAAGTPR